MKKPDTLNIDWGSTPTVLAVLDASAVAALPVGAEGKIPKRCLLTSGDTVVIGFTLSDGASAALTAVTDGVQYQRSGGYMIIETLGHTHINTWASGAGNLSVHALAD